MLWLLLAVISSAAVSIAIKTSEKYIENNVAITVVNYVICVVVAALYMGNPGTAVHEKSFGIAMLLAVIGGFLYVAGFLVQQWNIRVNGIVLTSVFAKMALLITMAISVVWFHERPDLIQILGFVLAIAAILVINLEKGSTRAASIAGLLLLLLCGGFSDGISKFYEFYCAPSLNGIILLVQFAVALLLSVLCLKYRKQRIGKPELVFGVIVGIPNYFASLFMLKALKTVPAVVMYPTYNIGAFLLISMTGLFVFGEKLSLKQFAGCGMIVAAILMLNQ